MSCSNNFKQIGLALHNYDASYKRLPRHMAGTRNPTDAGGAAGYTGDPITGGGDNRTMLSVFVGLTAFMEQQALWEQISNPLLENVSGTTMTSPWSPMGPVPAQIEYPPWMTEVPTLRCPSDSGIGLPAQGRTNYAACLGDSIWRANDGVAIFSGGRWLDNDAGRARHVRASCRGAFVPRQDTRFRDVLDGLSNTIAMGEIRTDLGERHITTAPLDNSADNVALRENPKFCEDDGPIPRPPLGDRS